MRIVIETDGNGSTTQVSFNGEPQRDLLELQLTVNAQRKVKMQMIRYRESDSQRKEFVSYYGEDFKKLDEVMSEKQ